MSGVFGGDTKISTTDPVIGSFRVSTSAFGKVKALVYGMNRVAANLLDYFNFQAIPNTTTTSSGGKGGGVTSTNTTYTYVVSIVAGLTEGLCSADVTDRVWWDKSIMTYGGLSRYLGSDSQTPLPWLTANLPSHALSYRGLNLVAGPLYLGGSASLPNLTFEVRGLMPYSNGQRNCAPANMLTDYLTHATHGVGWDAALLGNWSQWSSYCIANNFFIAPAYTTQEAASSAMLRLFQATNSAPVFSEGVLKVVPYGTEVVTGNSVTFTPDLTVQYALSDDDFQNTEADDPVTITALDPNDLYNQVTVKYCDQSNQYNDNISTPAQDLGDIEANGLRPLNVVELKEIPNAGMARSIAQLILQRVLYQDKTYSFTLGLRYELLEPMDLVSLTESTGSGLAGVVVRITAIEESEDGILTMTAEDFLGTVGAHVAYPTQAAGGYVPDYNAAPGDTNIPAIAEAPLARCQSGMYELWLGLSGSDADWGGCEVWVSNDSGGPYKRVGTQYGPARHGTLSAMLASSADPDTTSACSVDLSVSAGTLNGGTHADADQLNTLSWIGGEYVSFAGITLTAPNVYQLQASGDTYLRRGQFGSVVAAHAIGAKFMRCDGAVFKYSYDPALAGTTIYIKCLSFNRYAAATQNLADVSATTYTISGPVAGPAAPTDGDAAPGVLENTVTWTLNNSTHVPGTATEVWASETNDRSTATLVGKVTCPGSKFMHATLVGGSTWYYWLRVIDDAQMYSAWHPANATAGLASMVGYVGSGQIADGAILTELIADHAVTKLVSVSASSVALNAGNVYAKPPCIFHIVVPKDVTNPPAVVINGQVTIGYNGALASGTGTLKLWRFSTKGRYNTGTIASMSYDGLNTYANGSGTAWLSAGLESGENNLILLGDGSPWANDIYSSYFVNDTKVRFTSGDNSEITYTGPYELFRTIIHDPTTGPAELATVPFSVPTGMTQAYQLIGSEQRSIIADLENYVYMLILTLDTNVNYSDCALTNLLLQAFRTVK